MPLWSRLLGLVNESTFRNRRTAGVLAIAASQSDAASNTNNRTSIWVLCHRTDVVSLYVVTQKRRIGAIGRADWPGEH